MNASDTIETKEIERQRERVRVLCRKKRFEEAADLCAASSDEALIFTPREAIADFISETRTAEAARFYRISADLIWSSLNRQKTLYLSSTFNFQFCFKFHRAFVS